MNYVPPEPTGNGNDATFHKLTRERVFGPEGQLRNTPKMKFDHRHDGIWPRVKPARALASVAAPSVTKTVHFLQSLGDYFLTSEGIAVAKPFKTRCSIAAQNIYGTGINFTYPHNPAGGGPSGDALAYLYRKATTSGGALSEVQGMVPQYLVGDPITIFQPDDGAGTTAGVDLMSDPKDLVTSIGGIAVPIIWMDANVDGRAWTYFSNQSF